MEQKPNEYIISAKESQLIRVVKLICAVMVVFIHAIPSFKIEVRTLSQVVRFIWIECICSCAVPIFFVISGILLFRKPFSWGDNLRKKVKTLLIPYLLISTFWIVFYGVAQSAPKINGFFNNRDMFVSSWGFSDWIKAYIGGIIKDPDRWYGPAMGWLWFLRDLFVLNLFAPLLKHLVDNFSKLWFCLLGLLWVFLGTLNASWYRPIEALLFFSLGYFLVKHDIHFENVKRIKTEFLWCAWGACCMIGFICQRCERFLYGISSMVCILAIGCLLVRISERLLTKHPQSWVASLCRYSMPIYLFHEHGLSIAIKLVEKATGGGSVCF